MRRGVAGVTLGDATDKYLTDSKTPIGRNKRSVLEQIKSHPIAGKRCDEIKSADVVNWVVELGLTRARRR